MVLYIQPAAWCTTAYSHGAALGPEHRRTAYSFRSHKSKFPQGRCCDQHCRSVLLIQSECDLSHVSQASVTIDGVKFVVDCGFVKVRTACLSKINVSMNIVLDKILQPVVSHVYAVYCSCLSGFSYAESRSCWSHITRHLLQAISRILLDVTSGGHSSRDYSYRHDYAHPPAQVTWD